MFRQIYGFRIVFFSVRSVTATVKRIGRRTAYDGSRRHGQKSAYGFLTLSPSQCYASRLTAFAEHSWLACLNGPRSCWIGVAVSRPMGHCDGKITLYPQYSVIYRVTDGCRHCGQKDQIGKSVKERRRRVNDIYCATCIVKRQFSGLYGDYRPRHAECQSDERVPLKKAHTLSARKNGVCSVYRERRQRKKLLWGTSTG